MNDAESIKATQKNEYLEEEKRLLKVNVKELANLNDNVHKMSINLINLLKFLREYKLTIAKVRRSKPKNSGNLYLTSFFAKFKTNGIKLNRKSVRLTVIFSYHIQHLHLDYHTGSTIFFFRRYHNS